MGKGYGYFTGYPKHVFFILGNEFCERFSFYGMKAILVIYLNRALNYNEDEATAIYHGFNMACYFMPIFGAMLADGLIGKYKTIMYISVVYALGNAVMAMGAIPDDGTYYRWITFVGLALIAVGTGGIKPCVSAFGADQFDDEQSRQKESFFSMFYMAINMGSLLSMIITPILRSSVFCFDDNCYSLAFGIPAMLMFVAVIFFVVGTKWYKRTPPGNNIIGNLFGCVGHALRRRCTYKGESKEHWLDYSDDEYDADFIGDVKAVMRVLFMFLPLPVFWALFDQQGSRWTFQAGEMNGDLGAFVLQPDMIQVFNPIIVLTLVPLFESVIFPCFDKLKVPNSPLQRLGAGMFLAGLAFVLAGFLQIAVNGSQPPGIEADFSRVTLINSAPCDISAKVAVRDFEETFTLNFGSFSGEQDIPSGDMRLDVEFCNCYNAGNDVCVSQTQNFAVSEKNAYQYMFTYFQGEEGATTTTYLAEEEAYNSQSDYYYITEIYQNVTERTKKGLSTAMIANAVDMDLDIYLDTSNEREPRWRNISVGDIPAFEELIHTEYAFSYTPESINTTFWDEEEEELIGADVGQYKLENVDSRAGALYFVSVQFDINTYPNGSNKIIQVTHQVITSNDLSIFWMVPQYFVMSAGEVFFSVTGLSFAYSQSPPSMKAVLQAAWLLTNSFGNLIVMIIAGASLNNPMAEFFMFAGLMFLTVIIFSVMSLTYTYVDYTPVEEDDEEKKEPITGVGNDAFEMEEEKAKQKEKEIEAYMPNQPPPYSENEHSTDL